MTREALETYLIGKYSTSSGGGSVVRVVGIVGSCDADDLVVTEYVEGGAVEIRDLSSMIADSLFYPTAEQALTE